jgi:hypothetical protein
MSKPTPPLQGPGLTRKETERLEEISEHLVNEAMGSDYPQHETLNADAAFLRQLSQRALASPEEARPTLAELKARMLSAEVVDEVADEWTEGEEGLAPSFVRDLGETWLRVLAESFVLGPVGEIEITDAIVDRACAVAFVPPISEDRRDDMRRALEAVGFLTQPVSASPEEAGEGLREAVTNLIGRAWEASVALEGYGIESEIRARLDEAVQRVQRDHRTRGGRWDHCAPGELWRCPEHGVLEPHKLSPGWGSGEPGEYGTCPVMLDEDSGCGQVLEQLAATQPTSAPPVEEGGEKPFTMRIIDADGAEIGIGDEVRSLALDWGKLTVSGFSTQTPNHSGATLFVVGPDVVSEMPCHLEQTDEPGCFRAKSHRLMPAPAPLKAEG